jgi:hypothetical protein
MQMLTIRAASPESAREMLEALSAFRAELVEAADGHSELTVTLQGGNGEIIGVLNALAQYVNERPTGPARLSLDGRNYVMHPDSVEGSIAGE